MVNDTLDVCFACTFAHSCWSLGGFVSISTRREVCFYFMVAGCLVSVLIYKIGTGVTIGDVRIV